MAMFHCYVSSPEGKMDDLGGTSFLKPPYTNPQKDRKRWRKKNITHTTFVSSRRLLQETTLIITVVMDGHGDLAIRSKSDLSNPKIGFLGV